MISDPSKKDVVLLTVPQVAKLTHTSPPTVHRWIADEKIAVTRLGNRIFIQQEWLLDFFFTPEYPLTRGEMEDLNKDPQEIEDILACQIREREALKKGATKLSEIDPPPPEPFMSFDK